MDPALFKCQTIAFVLLEATDKISHARVFLNKIGYRCFHLREDPVTFGFTSENVLFSLRGVRIIWPFETTFIIFTFFTHE